MKSSLRVEWAVAQGGPQPPQTKMWVRGVEPPKFWCQKTLLHVNTFDISDFRSAYFLPQTTQELSKKHSEAGPPEQSDALSQIDYGHTRHCEDCLCQTNNAKSIFKNLSRDMRMAERKISSPVPATCQNAPPPLKIWGMIVRLLHQENVHLVTIGTISLNN